jgi:hypothetical protein
MKKKKKSLQNGKYKKRNIKAAQQLLLKPEPA